MMTRIALGVALTAVVGVTATAHAGAPAWCGTQKRALSSAMDPDELRNVAKSATLIDFLHTQLVRCARPNDGKLAALADKERAVYQKAHALSDAELDEILGVAATSTRTPDDEIRACPKAIRPAGEYSAEVAALPATVLGCTKDGSFGPSGVAWYLDFADQPPSQLALAYDIVSALGMSAVTAVQGYPQAMVDAPLLDRAAFDAEVGALHLNPTLHARALELFFVAKGAPERARAQLAAATDAQSQDLLALPDRAKTEWDKLYADHKPALDAAYAMERKVIDLQFTTAHPLGCGELRASFRGYAAAQKPKSVADIEAAAHDPVGFVLLEATALCDGAEGHMIEAQMENAVLRHNNGREFHGPRLYAVKLAADRAMALTNAGHPPAFTTGVFSPNPMLGMTTLDRATNSDSAHMSPLYDDPAKAQGNASQRATLRGHVKAATRSGDRLLVTFKPEKWQAPDQTCVKGRLVNWDMNGPIFDYACTVVGYHEESSTVQDMTMLPDVAGDLKAGQLVQVVASMAVSGQPSVGAVLMTGEQSGKAVKWTSLLGVPVGK